MQDDDLDHLSTSESTWILSWYSGSKLKQLMVSNTRSLRRKLVQFLRYITIMSENLNSVYPILVLWVSVGLQVAMFTSTNPKLTVAHELEFIVAKSVGAADGENELRELSSRMRWAPIQPSSIETVTKPRVTMREKLNVVRRW